ncbi:MAG TPA: DUF2520 domain-containing protein [Candidatus Sulfotelmatobacter sp.]
MAAKARIAIVGAGALGSALAIPLHRAGHTISAVIARKKALPHARQLARRVGARALSSPTSLEVDLVWFCVPDSEIARAARSLGKICWHKKIAFHSSGALTSDELEVLRAGGAAVASVHPMMTFVNGVQPSLRGVSFAVEGDRDAVRLARSMVRDLGGRAYPVRKQDKPLYHAWGMFASPMVAALIATAEEVAEAAGVRKSEMRRRMLPILRQTVENYASLGVSAAFSGPIARGDIDTVRRHLKVLAKAGNARSVYAALAGVALQRLPARNQAQLSRLLAREGK